MGTILFTRKCAVIVDVVTAVRLPAATVVYPSTGSGSQEGGA